jgi:hypothetical protein
VKGRAVRVTSDPKVETVAAPHRLTKLALRRRAPRCMNDARPTETNGRGSRTKNQSRQTGVLFTTRAERLSRTSPRYAYASPEPPGYRPGPGRNPAASPAVAVPGESWPVPLGPSGLTVRTLYTYTPPLSRGRSGHCIRNRWSMPGPELRRSPRARCRRDRRPLARSGRATRSGR